MGVATSARSLASRRIRRTLRKLGARGRAAQHGQRAVYIEFRTVGALRRRALLLGMGKSGHLFGSMFRYTPRGAGALDVRFPSHTHASEDGTGFPVNNTIVQAGDIEKRTRQTDTFL